MDDVEKCIATYLFPSLHRMTDNHVASKILSVIRENLPEGCPEELSKSWSGKSLRIAGITTLLLAAMHLKSSTPELEVGDFHFEKS